MKSTSHLILFAALIIFTISSVRAEEDPVKLRAEGMEALLKSDREPDAIVTAARKFAAAAAIYEKLKDETGGVEMNSYLYWCKKKMSSKNMDDFLGQSPPPRAAAKMTEIAKPVPTSEVQQYFSRAEKYAAQHPDDNLAIAIHYFEVADRFRGTDQSFTAQERSLKAMTQAHAQRPAATAPPTVSSVEKPVEAPAGKKRPMPTASEIKDAEKLIRGYFKAEFTKSAKADLLDLSLKLTKQASESKSGPAELFALWNLSATFAAMAGDLDALTNALDQLSANFEGDFKDKRKTELSVLAFKSSDPRVSRFAGAMKVLVDNPADPTASQTVGKFYCYTMHDFEKGLPYLEKSPLPAVAELAKKERASPADTEAESLGEAWCALRDKSVDKDERAGVMARALFWYRKALPSLTGIKRNLIETRMATIETDFYKAAVQAGTVINLLQLVDPVKDSVEGTWTLKNGVLISDKAAQQGRIEFPCQLPDEYDFRVSFTRVAGNEAVCLLLARGGNQGIFVMGGWQNSITGIQVLGGKYAIDNDNKTMLKKGLVNGQRNTIVAQVRRDSITIIHDGKIIIQLQTNFSDLSSPDNWKLHDPKLLGLACSAVTVHFHSIELLEISGKAKPTR